MELLGYFLDALSPFNLVLALGGVVLGTIIGALPGLSATMAVAVLVPFTFTMNPAAGLLALSALYTGSIYGEAFHALLARSESRCVGEELVLTLRFSCAPNLFNKNQNHNTLYQSHHIFH